MINSMSSEVRHGLETEAAIVTHGKLLKRERIAPSI